MRGGWMSPSQKGKSGHLRGLGWRSCRRLPNQSKSSTALGEGRCRRAFLPGVRGPKGSPRALGALGQMQRVVSRGGDLSPEAAVPFTPGSSHRAPKSPPYPSKSSLHSAGLEASVFQSFPSAPRWELPRRGSGTPPEVSAASGCRALPRSLGPGPRPSRRGLARSRGPGSARAHLAHRGGRTGRAGRGTCRGGEGPSGLRGRRPRVVGLGGTRPGRRAESVSRGEPPLRNPHPDSRRRASRRASPPDPVLSEPLCAPPPGPPFIVGSAPASSATNGSASCRRVTAARTQWRRARRSAAFPN